jgi:hypothetical protein
LSFTGKILLFKKLSIRSNDTFSDFRPVPSTLTLAQGVELLKKELEKDQSAARPASPKARDSKSQDKAEKDAIQSQAEAAKTLCCDR